jgi:hypothetical protein
MGYSAIALTGMMIEDYTAVQNQKLSALPRSIPAKDGGPDLEPAKRAREAMAGPLETIKTIFAKGL